MIGERLVLYPWNWYGGHLVLVHLSISLELWHESYKDTLMGQIQLATTIQTFDPDHISNKNQYMLEISAQKIKDLSLEMTLS